MSEHGEDSQRVCQNKFGSWNEALREAGYAPNRKCRLTDQDLLDEIDRLAEQLGRPLSSASATIYRRASTSSRSVSMCSVSGSKRQGASTSHRSDL